MKGTLDTAKRHDDRSLSLTSSATLLIASVLAVSPANIEGFLDCQC